MNFVNLKRPNLWYNHASGLAITLPIWRKDEV